MRIGGAIDLGIRVVLCVLIAPLLVAMRVVLPMSGILVNVGLALAMVLATERLGRLATVPLLGRVVRRLQRIPAYYAEHPPRSAFYYLFYPLLAPYWLISRQARAEFGLYRAFNVMTMGVLTIAGGIEYWRWWRPELGFTSFLGADVAIVIFQLLITMVFVMPLVTTVVILRERKRSKLLIAIAILGGALAVFAAWKAHATPAQTVTRLRMRTAVARPRAEAAMDAGLRDALAILATGQVVFDAPVEGPALAAARRDLRALYKSDEAAAFRLFATRTALVLYVPSNVRDPVWRAIDAHGQPITDRDRLDAAAWAAMAQPP